MNIGKDKRHPKYICDKCGKEICYWRSKGFKGLNKYYKQKPASNPIKKNFDLGVQNLNVRYCKPLRPRAEQVCVGMCWEGRASPGELQ